MNQNKFHYTPLLLAAFAAIAISGCSSTPKNDKNNITISSNAPTVVNAVAEPETIVLNGELQPVNPAQVLADVKDFKSHVIDTRLKFLDVPLDVPMENVGGTTWKAELTPQELQMLAVGGRTAKYRAQVIARSADGQVSEGHPVAIAVKAPDFAHQFG